MFFGTGGGKCYIHHRSSSDINPCCYDLNPRLKQTLCRKCFANTEEILTAVWCEVAHMMLVVFAAFVIIGNELWNNLGNYFES